MTINRIDSWNWTSPEMASQVSVDTGGQQANNGLTILVCVPGATICIFRTQFTEDFFKTDGTVKGLGDVVLQFAMQESDVSSVSRRRNLVTNISSKRQLQVPETPTGLIVGTARVEVNTPVANSINDLPVHCQYEHSLAGWWEEESKKDKAMHIALVAGLLAVAAGSLLCCWCCPCRSRKSEEEIIIEKDDAGNVKVNVDVKSGKDATTVSNQSLIRASSKFLQASCDGTETSESSKEPLKSQRLSSKNILEIADGSAEGGPELSDVCFQDRSHQGTKKLIKAIRQYQKCSPNEHFGPQSYRIIKKELGNVRFFRTNKKGRFVETSKKETVALMGDLFDQVKDGKLPRTGSANSLSDLESIKGKVRGENRHSNRSLYKEKRSSSRSVLADVKETAPIKRSTSKNSLR